MYEYSTVMYHTSVEGLWTAREGVRWSESGGMLDLARRPPDISSRLDFYAFTKKRKKYNYPYKPPSPFGLWRSLVFSMIFFQSSRVDVPKLNGGAFTAGMVYMASDAY